MPIFKWKEAFLDIRECAVEASSIEEAKSKVELGEWLYEDTVDFYSEGIVQPLSGPYEIEGD